MKISIYFSVACIVVLSFLLDKAAAEISLPKIIGHNMVLQCKKPVPVWGYATVGEKVTVKFGTQIKRTITDSSGKWQIILDPLKASNKPAQMLITGSNTITLDNILVGEVWLCSGQSNMEYSMRRNSKVNVLEGITDWPVNELDLAHEPNIRIFLVERKKMNPDSTHFGWSIAEDSALRSFSAVAYFFAKKMYKELHVPIGVISSAIPGSRIEPWASEEAFANSPNLKDKKDSSGKIAGEPGKFYQTMIAPLAPFALNGFLWYQGETNCFLKETIQYTYKMQALINNWRTIWGNRSLPFYFVQITPFAYSKTKGKISLSEETLPEFREAQTWALKIPYTGMIVTTDLNDSLDNLHPHFKWEIGRRLALVALVKTYGKKEIQASGPIFARMQVKADKALLEFNYTGKGLISKDGKALNCFTVAGADGKFVPANAVIKGDQVIVSSPEVTLPVAVRLGWNEADHPNLFNRDGLPAMPFRTNSPLPQKL